MTLVRTRLVRRSTEVLGLSTSVGDWDTAVKSGLLDKGDDVGVCCRTSSRSSIGPTATAVSCSTSDSFSFSTAERRRDTGVDMGV